MEFIDSDNNETYSDELDEDLENELYSVLHYNVLSEDIPSNLLDKYDIKKTEQNEFLISLKKAKQEQFEGTKDTTHKTIVSEQNDDSAVVSSPNFITISDDSDSDVILSDPVLEVTYVSSPSVVEVSDSSSGSDMGEDVILNIGDTTTLSSIFPVDNSEEEVIKVKWKEVTSPCSWTNDMKKYYNKPCERLKNFDYKKVREEIKGNGNWHINLADRLPTNWKVKRCQICRQTDHQRKNCPRRFVNCYMCGNSGHNDSNCPSKKCLNCGRKNKVFVAMCHRCEQAKFQTCSECQQKGHTKDLCPDAWRRYHATTEGELVIKEVTVNERLMCCNCAQSGHLFENCPKLYWSLYPPTSCLIKKTEEPVHKSPKGKRFRGTGEDTVDFVRTPKKSRLNQNYSDKSPNRPNWNHGSFNRTSTQYSDLTPTSLDRSRTPFSRNPVSFNQNPSPFVRNPTSFDRTSSSPLSQRSTPFNQRSTPFSQRSTPFSQRSTPFSQRSTPFGQRSTTFSQGSTTFNQGSTTFNQGSTPFNQRSTPFSQRSTTFNQGSTPFNQGSTPIHQRSTPFNQTSIPFNEASTSSKPVTPKKNKKIRYFHNNSFGNNQESIPFNQGFTPFNQKSTPIHKRSTRFNEASTSSKPVTPKKNKKTRYFHNNSFGNKVNTIKHSHNQIRSPKMRTKKRKKKNTPQ